MGIPYEILPFESQDAIKVLDNAVNSATELAKAAINAYHVHKGTVSREDLELPGDELMGDDNWDGDKPKGAVDEAEVKPVLKRPAMYKVLLLNDDYTPMEFVVHVLEQFFGMNREKATQIMLTVHTAGAAVVGVFPKDIAETKSEQVNEYSRENQHPLMSTVEASDDEE